MNLLGKVGMGELNQENIYDPFKKAEEIVKDLKVNNPIMIGHSFGGKISLIYASKYKTQKLVLFGSPFKKEIKKLSIKTKILKALKKVPVLKRLEGFAKKYIGSRDYRQASEFMRKILVEHVNLDIEEDVKKIKCPTRHLYYYFHQMELLKIYD